MPKGDALVIGRTCVRSTSMRSRGAFGRRQADPVPTGATHALPGTVTCVSADGFTDQSAGQTYYKVRVEIDPEHINDLELYPGMPAEVTC